MVFAQFGDRVASWQRAMDEAEHNAEDVAEAIKQENSTSISKIRSLFVDPGFLPTPPDDAGSAAEPEELPQNEI